MTYEPDNAIIYPSESNWIKVKPVKPFSLLFDPFFIYETAAGQRASRNLRALGSALFVVAGHLSSFHEFEEFFPSLEEAYKWVQMVGKRDEPEISSPVMNIGNENANIATDSLGSKRKLPSEEKKTPSRKSRKGIKGKSTKHALNSDHQTSYRDDKLSLQDNDEIINYEAKEDASTPKELEGLPTRLEKQTDSKDAVIRAMKTKIEVLELQIKAETEKRKTAEEERKVEREKRKKAESRLDSFVLIQTDLARAFKRR